jgi:hypothetical protein
MYGPDFLHLICVELNIICRQNKNYIPAYETYFQGAIEVKYFNFNFSLQNLTQFYSQPFQCDNLQTKLFASVENAKDSRLKLEVTKKIYMLISNLFLYQRSFLKK